MPHKRAKRSVREADRKSKGYNLPPSASKDDTPRGALRILNAGKVQAAFRASGRTNSEDTGEVMLSKPKDKGKKRARDDGDAEDEGQNGVKPEKDKKTKEKKSELPKIAPHESLGEYNRRIESLMRSGVSSAIKKAEHARGQQVRDAAEAKKKRIALAQGKAVPDEKEEESNDGELKPNRPAVEFKELPKRRRVNDVAQAPPQLPRMRMAEKADKAGKTAKSTRTPVNAGQARIMEEERERVIARYRELKASKLAEKQAEKK